MQPVEVILLRTELIHDIEAVIHQLERKSKDTASAALLPAGASADYLLSRHIDTAVNQALASCQAYLAMPSPFAHRIATDHAMQWEEKSILLAMPLSWPLHHLDPLRDAIHSFIVYRALQLFLAFSDEKAAAVCDERASDFCADIAVHLSARSHPLQCAMSPFG